MQNRRFSKKPASFAPSDLSLSETRDPGQSDPSQDRFIRGIIKRKVGQRSAAGTADCGNQEQNEG
jgi:hypothetical protein